VADPTLALRCLIVYQVVQFIEGQFIYPRVIGGSIGMLPLYTLIAALIGGKLLGIIGMIFFIPLSAVVYDFIKADSKRRLKERDISVPICEGLYENTKEQIGNHPAHSGKGN